MKQSCGGHRSPRGQSLVDLLSAMMAIQCPSACTDVVGSSCATCVPSSLAHVNAMTVGPRPASMTCRQRCHTAFPETYRQLGSSHNITNSQNELAEVNDPARTIFLRNMAMTLQVLGKAYLRMRLVRRRSYLYLEHRTLVSLLSLSCFSFLSATNMLRSSKLLSPLYFL